MLKVCIEKSVTFSAHLQQQDYYTQDEDVTATVYTSKKQ